MIKLYFKATIIGGIDNTRLTYLKMRAKQSSNHLALISV